MLRSTQRWKLRLIVNRYLLDVGLSREVIGTALHTEVFDTLPSDYEAVQRALMDGKTPVADVVAKAAKDAGTTIVLKDYVRFQLGEGIEREVSDFAAEVAAAAGVN